MRSRIDNFSRDAIRLMGIVSTDPFGPKTTATGDLRLPLKGGDGDDRLVALGGTGAVLVGGDGSDFLFNTTAYGQLYGGNIDGQGSTDTDIFWYWPGTFIMDAGKEDILELFGLPLLGGTNIILGQAIGDGSFAIDWFNWFVFYARTTSGQLIVYNVHPYIEKSPHRLYYAANNNCPLRIAA